MCVYYRADFLLNDWQCTSSDGAWWVWSGGGGPTSSVRPSGGRKQQVDGKGSKMAGRSYM